MFDGIVRSDTTALQKYHTMIADVIMVSKIINTLILKGI